MKHFQPDRELANIYTLCGGFMIKTAILLAAAFVAGAAQAEEQCTLRQVASLDLTHLPDGALSIPITLSGKKQPIALDISDPFSYLYADYGDAEKFKISKLPSGIVVNVNGRQSKQLYKVPDIAIGNAGGKDIQFVRAEGPHRFGEEVVGELALDLLAGFDAELDLKSGKLNLFSQYHCPGQVVYWAKTYAVLPFQTDASGHTNFKMMLDGKWITVSLELAPTHGRMGTKTAKRLFDIDESAPGLEKVPDLPADAPVVYRYPFKSLGIEGVAITNPTVHLYQQTAECRSNITIDPASNPYRCFGGSDLRIGQAILSQLHLYFAFKEKKLYVTAADAH